MYETIHEINDLTVYKIEGFSLLFCSIVAFHMLYVYSLYSELLVENLRNVIPRKMIYITCITLCGWIKGNTTEMYSQKVVIITIVHIVGG